MLNLEQCTVSESVKRMLDTMFVQKRIPQALIIEGDHARTTELARVLASGLVCQAQDNKPCGKFRLKRISAMFQSGSKLYHLLYWSQLSSL